MQENPTNLDLTQPVEDPNGTVAAVDPLPEGTTLVPYTPPGGGAVQVKRLLASLRDAIDAGNITARQAAELRRQLGISKAYFTKKRMTRAKKRVRAKMAEASRRANRGTGKGEKRTGGI